MAYIFLKFDPKIDPIKIHEVFRVRARGLNFERDNCLSTMRLYRVQKYGHLFRLAVKNERSFRNQ